MTRRRFLARSGSLAAAAIALHWMPRRVAANPLGKPIGIQLYTVKEAIEADAAGTLKRLRAIGYREVETAGFGKLTARQFRQRLDDNGLACPSAHLGFEAGKFEGAFADAHALGAHYAASGSLDGLIKPAKPNNAAGTRAMGSDEAKRTAELCNRIGAAAQRAGLQYVYHNHAFEFADTGEAEIGYDILLRETDPKLVQFEIDCGWMAFAGRDPVEYFRKHPRRFPLIHVKDFLRRPGDASAEMSGAELGRGVVDYAPIFAAAAKAGLRHYFVEQEGPFARMEPMQAVKVDYAYLHALG